MSVSVSLLMQVVLALCYHSNGAFSVLGGDCKHGNLNSDRTACICEPCWTGDDCSIRAQKAPYFRNGEDKITLNYDHLDGETLYFAQATDLDRAHCPHEDKKKCPCSNVEYSITSNNENGIFKMHKNTGELTLNLPFSPIQKEYSLQIGASDEDGNLETMLLTIDSRDLTGPEASNDNARLSGLDDVVGQYPAHHLQKRSITLPVNATFSLVKYGTNMAEVEMKVGTRIQFRLEILFPSGSTDMQVELFAPDSDDIIMMLCEVQVTKGDNLDVTGTITPEMESNDNTIYKDRAIIALGTVTNSGADVNTEEPSKITVTYEAVMIENTNTVDSTEYWVSAGAEFNNKNDVWVGQASFTAKTADDSASFTTTPEFKLQGPASLEIGSSALYSLDMYIPNPVIDLEVDVFASVNVSDVMSICGGKLVSVSESYSCSIGDLWSYEPTLSADGNTKGHGRLHMSLGRPINKLARESSNVTEHRLSFQFVVKMHNDENYVGNPYYLGSSVQIGASKIWAGQIQIAAAAKTDGVAVTPVFSTGFVDNTKISQNDPVKVKLDVEIPLNSNADYLLEILVPFNDSQSIFQVCSVGVLSIGANLGCMSSDEIEPVFAKSTDDTLIPDKVTVDLGKLTNLGDWGWVNPNDTSNKNVLSLSITFKGTNHSLATLGSTHDVILGMYVGTTRLVVGKVSIEVGPESPAPAITADNTPSFNMYFSDGLNEAVFGQTVKFILDVTTARSTIYSPMDFEFIMANKSGNPMAHICKVDLESAGKNNPCVIKELVESMVQQISSFGDDHFDRAILNLASLCNIEHENDTAEDHVKLGVSVVLLDQPEYQTDNKTWLSAGVMYSPSTLWVGQLAVYASVNGPKPSASQTPHLGHAPYNATITHVPHGYSAKHLIRIKLSPNDTTSLKLNISTLDNALSICGLRYVRAGAGYPCASLIDGTVGMTADEDETIGAFKGGFIDLGMMSNVGSTPLEANDDFDDNTIEVELLAKMTIDTSLAPDNSEHEMELVLSYNTNPEATLTSTVTLTTTTDTSAIDHFIVDDVNATSSIGSISGTNETLPNEDLGTIVPGESKRVLIFIDTEMNSTSQLSVKMLTPVSVADIMNVDYLGVYEVGSNIPCVKREQTSATYEPRVIAGPNKDIGSLDLSYVCNTGLDKTDPNANTLVVEGVIRMDKDAADTVSLNTALDFHTTVTSNGQELHVFKHTLTMADAATFIDYFEINETSKGIEGVINNETDPITMTIGEVKTIPIVFTVPPYMSAKVVGDVRMPVNTSAIMTLNEVKVVANGKNVPDIEASMDLFKVMENRQHNTSQITSMDLDFGVISNAGMSQRSHDYVKWDDTFTLEVTMQMADNELAQDNSEHKISFGLDVSKFIYILDVTVTVSRTGSEAIVFNVSSAVDDVNSTATRIEVDTMIAHEDVTSTREGLNCIFNIFLPPYVSHTESVITSKYKDVLNVDKEENAITISFGPLFFTDVIYMTTVIEANSSFKVPPGVSGSDSIFQFQVVCDTYDQYNLTSDLDYVNFTTTTTAESGSSCTPTLLGMQSNAILDCQISASRDSITDPIHGRHTTGSGWSPFVHSGKVKEERYYQVYFGHKTIVHSVSLQQPGSVTAKKMTIRHSDDGIAWVEDPTNEVPVDHLSADQVLAVPVPVSSRYIRVMITETNDETASGLFKFDFTGCVTEADGPADLCTGHTEPTKLPDFHSRSFLVAGTVVYACDGRKKDLSIEQRCYSSTDGGTTWSELDSRVGSVLGYDSEEPRVYGVSSDGLYYMSSEDGNQWQTSVPSDVTNSKTLLTFKPSKKVPLDGDTKLNSANPHADYTDGVYGATITGLSKNEGVWGEKFRWGTCC